MKCNNYFDKNGNYINCENISLAEIYHRAFALGVESVAIPTGWIPVEYHVITEEERKENAYPDEWVYCTDCHMPDDGDEILITLQDGRVEKDVCYLDDAYSLDSGYDWIDDIKAWMPLPKGYKKEE